MLACIQQRPKMAQTPAQHPIRSSPTLYPLQLARSHASNAVRLHAAVAANSPAHAPLSLRVATLQGSGRKWRRRLHTRTRRSPSSHPGPRRGRRAAVTAAPRTAYSSTVISPVCSCRAVTAAPRTAYSSTVISPVCCCL